MPFESQKSSTKDKGKQREHAKDDKSEQLSLDPRRFVNAQIKALNTPFDSLYAQDYVFENEKIIDQKVIDKAVRGLRSVRLAIFLSLGST